MAIPDFQSIFLPLLKHAGDGHEHTNIEAIEALAGEFDLTEKELSEFMPNGNKRIFYNRVTWAKTYLKKAGLLALPSRGVFQITDRGKDVLKKPPEKLNVKYLKQYDEFTEFLSPVVDPDQSGTSGNEEDGGEDGRTPEELLESGYKSIRSSLAVDLLSEVKQMSPAFFEQLVVDLLMKMGYGESGVQSGLVTGGSGDEGIDGIISEDKLGLDIIYIQAKRWEGSVGRPEVQKFVGALQGKRAKKGVFITTSSFTKDAEEYANRVETRVILIDGRRLSSLMIDHGVGVAEKKSYQIKAIDSDYFVEE